MIRIRKWYHLFGLVYLGVIMGVLGVFAMRIARVMAHYVRPYDNGFADQVESFAFIGLMVCAPVYICLRQTIYLIQSRNRTKELKISAHYKKLKDGLFQLSPSINELTIDMERRKHENSYLAHDWGYTDFTFTNYRKLKDIIDRAESYHYAIACFMLPRALPNVFFDSKKSGGREFKVLFHKKQLHSLEGDFDRYFRTYFTSFYTIDSLSFITPEVLEAIKEAKNYDVEIYQDRLYLYSEFQKMPQQLDEMEKIGKNIRNKLMNNITTYRDERIEFEDGRATVSPIGFQLKRSTTWLYVMASIGAGIVVISLLISFWFVIEFSVFPSFMVFFIGAGFALCGGAYRRIQHIRSHQEYIDYLLLDSVRGSKHL